MSRFAPHLGLLIALFVEVLYLTASYDTQHLDKLHTSWAPLLGWTPEYLRVAITTVVVAVLVSGAPMWVAIREAPPEATRVRASYLAVHALAFAVFFWISATVMDVEFPSNAHPGRWAVGWMMAGAASMLSWGAAVLPFAMWTEVMRRGRVGLYWGLSTGIVAWTGGFLSQEFWKPLARYTFNVVAWLLGWIYADTVSEPATFVLGTKTFSVNIAPACSGYEGIGLILAFLSIYLWVSRKTLRFPHALILLPVGASAIWVLNSLRIAALIVIGTSGWPDVALGGFHSQAGWLSFNAVGLGLVAVSVRGRYFTATAPSQTLPADNTDATAAYLAPFLAIVATTMVTGAFSAGFDWWYPARVIAAGLVLWSFRGHYAEMRWRWSGSSIAIGAVAFAIWLALMPTGVTDKDGWPAALGAASPTWAALWLAVRVLGYVVTTPIAEELAFRGFLTRRIMRADFQRVPVTEWSWFPCLLSSLVFGALHGQFWLAGTIAGMLFAVALYRGRGLGDAVQAHATTNGLMVVYVFATGHWSAWS